MNIQKKVERNKAILEYLQTHTLEQAAQKFDLSLNQIFRIKKFSKGGGKSAE